MSILDNFESNKYSALEWSPDSKVYDTRKVEELLAYARHMRDSLFLLKEIAWETESVCKYGNIGEPEDGDFGPWVRLSDLEMLLRSYEV